MRQTAQNHHFFLFSYARDSFFKNTENKPESLSLSRERHIVRTMGKRGNRSRKRQQQKQQQQEQQIDLETCNGDKIVKSNREETQGNDSSSPSSPKDESSSLGLTVTLEGDEAFMIPSPLEPETWRDEDGSTQQAWKYIEKKRKERKWSSPTPIQRMSWPLLMLPATQETKNNYNLQKPPDIIGVAPTGSGKTLSYGLPIIAKAHEEMAIMKSSSSTKSSFLEKPCIYCLVLVPTRELATQVAKEMTTVCKAFKSRKQMEVLAIYGGVSKKEQLASFNNSDPQLLFVAGTPGRLLDLMKNDDDCEDEAPRAENHLTNASSSTKCILPFFHGIKFIVFDEADRLANNTDIASQVDSILTLIRAKQMQLDRSKSDNHEGSSLITSCLYSATFPENVTEKWNTWLSNPKVCMKVDTFSVGGDKDESSADKAKAMMLGNSMDESATNCDADEDTNQDKSDIATLKRNRQVDLSQIPSHVTQTLHVCSGHKKPKKLMITLNKIRKEEKSKGSGTQHHQRRRQGLCIVFFGRIKTLQYVDSLLVKEGFKCTEIHSQMNQQQRERSLLNFKAGKVTILLATDIAARGIHVNNVEYVINYDFPGSLEQYVHRCGRAGRDHVNTTPSSGSDGDFLSTSGATVYSFFTRELAPMAKDVISLLQSSKAWVDPNLLELVPGGEEGNGNEHRQKKRKKQVKVSVSGENQIVQNTKGTQRSQKAPAFDSNDDDDDWDDGQFSGLSAKRIVLKRASHVSDASDSESEE